MYFDGFRIMNQVNIFSIFLKIPNLYLRYSHSKRNDTITTATKMYKVKGELNIS